MTFARVVGPWTKNVVGSPEGHYLIAHGVQGGHHGHDNGHMHSSTTTADLPAASAHPLERKIGGFWNRACGCDRHPDEDATARVVNALIGDVQRYDDPGRKLLPHESIIKRDSGVIVFVVNNDERYGDRSHTIDADELRPASDHISDHCQRFVTGTTGAENAFAIGYMLESNEGGLLNQHVGIHCGKLLKDTEILLGLMNQFPMLGVMGYWVT
ncbi:uncharacterized protein B0I36DRAFT_354833 [Microdochium trichocladiopsis]|uniref:Uncharacterized protein n=1 Tax=Microdochium trichocladiopsis TaxID=1682393 RepID=A0A9P9BHK2_9PEZI|nr:uncharacterized protein B0I36DRAFT_354833 [Microdochium trichocladiopsis]KAH7018569.1 hypothetical protein B0I36DRAFT_354833 [Microdochium trichocladiopsis]